MSRTGRSFVVLLSCLTLATVADAQQQGFGRGGRGAAPAAFGRTQTVKTLGTKPCVLFSFAAIGTLLERVEKLAKMVGVDLPPSALQNLDAVRKTPGLDLRRRVGAFAYASDPPGDTRFVVFCVPITDARALLEFVNGFTRVRPKPQAPGRFVVMAPGQPGGLHLRVEPRWIWASPVPQLLEGQLPSPEGNIAVRGGRADFSLKVDFSGFSDAEFARYMGTWQSQYSEGVSQAFRLLPAARKFKFVADLLASQVSTDRRDEFFGVQTFSLNLPGPSSPLSIEVSAAVNSSSRLGAWIGQLEKSSVRFGSIGSSSSIFRLAVASRLVPELQQLLQSQIYELRSSGGKSSDNPLFQKFCDVLLDTVRAGDLQVGLAVDGDSSGRLALQGALGVARGSDVEQLYLGLADMLAAGGMPGFRRAEPKRFGSRQLHSLSMSVEGTDFARAFGRRASAHFAFPGDAILFSVAPDGRSETALKSLLRATSDPGAQRGRGRFLECELNFKALLEAGADEFNLPPLQKAKLPKLSNGVRLRVVGEYGRNTISVRAEVPGSAFQELAEVGFFSGRR